MQEHCLTVYNGLTGSAAEQTEKETSLFTVQLWNQKGDELAGTYSYTGSREGTLKSGDTIELAGNEFVTIDPVLKGCTYQVSRKENGVKTESHETEGVISEDGTAAWFTRNTEDTSERAVFSKGETYLITETTIYSGDQTEVSSCLSFNAERSGGYFGCGGI